MVINIHWWILDTDIVIVDDNEENVMLEMDVMKMVSSWILKTNTHVLNVLK